MKRSRIDESTRSRPAEISTGWRLSLSRLHFLFFFFGFIRVASSESKFADRQVQWNQCTSLDEVNRPSSAAIRSMSL